MTDTQRAMSSKGAKGGPWGHNFKLTLDVLELQMKRKNKKVSLVFNGNFKTYTKYYGVTDEDQ